MIVGAGGKEQEIFVLADHQPRLFFGNIPQGAIVCLCEADVQDMDGVVTEGGYPSGNCVGSWLSTRNFTHSR